jgi:hypothetical protein
MEWLLGLKFPHINLFLLKLQKILQNINVSIKKRLKLENFYFILNIWIQSFILADWTDHFFVYILVIETINNKWCPFKCT